MRLSSRLSLLCALALVYSAVPTLAPPPVYDAAFIAQKDLRWQSRAERLESGHADHHVVHAPPPLRYEDRVRSKVERLTSDPRSLLGAQGFLATKMSQERWHRLQRRASEINPIHGTRPLKATLRRRSPRFPRIHKSAFHDVPVAKVAPAYNRAFLNRHIAAHKQHERTVIRKALEVQNAQVHRQTLRMGSVFADNPHHVFGTVRALSGRSNSMAVVGRDGLTFEPCVRKKDCKSSRFCLELESLPNISSCDGTKSCVCFPREQVECKSSSDCVKGEVCVFAEDEHGQICVSKKIVDINPLEVTDPEVDPSTEPPATPPTNPPGNPSGNPPGNPPGNPSGNPSVVDSSSEPPANPPTEGSDEPSGDSGDSAAATEPSTEPSLEPSPESEVCIDAKSLRHLSMEDLVFEKHVWATVLCDENESCATGGHMVSFRGRPMRMKTYCSIVECVQRVMLVNSPRFSRGLQVKSNTGGLYFTAFAARYNTRIEEAMLSVAVRAGL